MKISKSIEIIDLALWMKKNHTLIVGDIHLGYEESLHHKGVFVPKQQAALVINKFKTIFKQVKPRTIIINGDLKHDFGKILQQEWKEVLRLIDFLLSNCKELVLVKGNHDTILGPIASKREILVVKEHLIDNILIVHGDKLVDENNLTKTIIIGHEHPAITLKEGSKIEKYKCFLRGKWKKKELIVLPSFNPLSYGSDIVSQRRFSPFLTDISKFNVFIVNEGEVYKFGKARNFTP